MRFHPGGRRDRTEHRAGPAKAKAAGLAGIARLAGGAALWRTWSHRVWGVGKGAPYEPWQSWADGEGTTKLIHAAVLAANAHNTQPWRFRIGRDEIAVFADLERNIGSFDPFRRELHQSIGCALENIALAAQAQGQKAQIEMAPGRLSLAPPAGTADPEPIATIKLAPAEQAESELYRAIPQRHTHRGVYRPDKPVPEAMQAEMHACISAELPVSLFLFSGDATAPLAKLIIASTRAIIEDRQMADDNAKWFRFNSDAVELHRDGLTLDTNVMAPLQHLGAKLFPPSDEAANSSWRDTTAKVHLRAAPLLGMIAVPDLYDQRMALAVGRIWQRLHLLLTARGLVAQPLNQPAARVDRERELNMRAATGAALAEITGDAAWQPTFIFRAGYADRMAPPSPRRPVAAVISPAPA